MGRLPGFDYRQPLYYMVTLKKRPGLPDFAHAWPRRMKIEGSRM